MESMKTARAVLIATSFLALSAAGCRKEAPPPKTDSPVATQPAPHAPVAIPRNHIYDESANPQQQIAAALKQAKLEHKRVILEFGGDWCGDCQVLYYYLHKEPNQALLEKNFVMVPIWVGRHIELNRDLAAKYGVPLAKGVPALAVLDADGKVIHSQAEGEFADMRNMDEKYATQFLEQWKA